MAGHGCPARLHNRSIRRHLEPVVQDFDHQLGRVYPDLEECNAGFEALEQLEEHESLFTEEEMRELKPLFGWYSPETDKLLPPAKFAIEYAAVRQQHWIDIRHRSREPARRLVDECVDAFYSLLPELMQSIGQVKEKPSSSR